MSKAKGFNISNFADKLVTYLEYEIISMYLDLSGTNCMLLMEDNISNNMIIKTIRQKYGAAPEIVSDLPLSGKKYDWILIQDKSMTISQIYEASKHLDSHGLLIVRTDDTDSRNLKEFAELPGRQLFCVHSLGSQSLPKGDMTFVSLYALKEVQKYWASKARLSEDYENAIGKYIVTMGKNRTDLVVV